jgi:hypothetical protein
MQVHTRLRASGGQLAVLGGSDGAAADILGGARTTISAIDVHLILQTQYKRKPKNKSKT